MSDLPAPQGDETPVNDSALAEVVERRTELHDQMRGAREASRERLLALLQEPHE